MILTAIDTNPIREVKYMNQVKVDREKVKEIVKEALVDALPKYKLTSKQVDKIQQVLEMGNRIELIPCKDGIKIIQEVRNEIK